MILIISHKQDFTTDFVIDKLNKREIPYKRLNVEDIDDTKYKIVFNAKLGFDLGGTGTFKSIWYRRIKLPPLSETLSDSERQFLLSEYYSLIQNLLLIQDVKWLSHPLSISAAENKLYQLKKALEIDFLIPRTIITNDAHALKSFHFENNNGTIIKPLSQNKLIFTNKILANQIDNIGEFYLTPSIIQEYIAKDYEVRVTVVGDSVFSAKVSSQSEKDTKVDWRRKKLPFEKHVLPQHISSKCVALVRSLNLSFGAIDLIKSVDDNYYFLEINPNGQWAWIETDTGLPISDSIINYLL